jgi:biopolymer transport protein ExbD
MAMDVGSNPRGPKGEINITPLIDVVLVLLIIFMVLLPATLKQLTATVPPKSEGTPPPGPEQTVLKIGAQGELLLNSEPVTPESLPGRVRQRLARDGQGAVLFDVDDDARYGQVIRFMDLVKGAGARTLAIVTKD